MTAVTMLNSNIRDIREQNYISYRPMVGASLNMTEGALFLYSVSLLKWLYFALLEGYFFLNQFSRFPHVNHRVVSVYYYVIEQGSTIFFNFKQV